MGPDETSATSTDAPPQAGVSADAVDAPALPFPEPVLPQDALDVPVPRAFHPSADSLRSVKLPPMPLNLPPSERSGPVRSVPLPLAAHLGELVEHDEDTEATPPTAIPGAGFDGLVAGWGDDEDDDDDDAPPAVLCAEPTVDVPAPAVEVAPLPAPAPPVPQEPSLPAPSSPVRADSPIAVAPSATPPAAAPNLVVVVGVTLLVGVGLGAALMWALR